MPIPEQVIEFTYSGDPAQSDLATVRYLVGDIDPSAPLVDDRAINWELTQWPNIYLAAASVADAIASLLSRTAGMTADGVTYGDAAAKFRTRATELRQRAAARGAVPFAGGISISDKDTREADGDRALPTFTRRTGLPSSSTTNITDLDGWADTL